jgi:hypothetical protein
VAQQAALQPLTPATEAMTAKASERKASAPKELLPASSLSGPASPASHMVPVVAVALPAAAMVAFQQAMYMFVYVISHFLLLELYL